MFQNTRLSWFPFLNNASDFSQKLFTRAVLAKVSRHVDPNHGVDHGWPLYLYMISGYGTVCRKKSIRIHKKSYCFSLYEVSNLKRFSRSKTQSVPQTPALSHLHRTQWGLVRYIFTTEFFLAPLNYFGVVGPATSNTPGKLIKNSWNTPGKLLEFSFQIWLATLKKHLPFIRLETSSFCASEKYRDFRISEFTGIRRERVLFLV